MEDALVREQELVGSIVGFSLGHGITSLYIHRQGKSRWCMTECEKSQGMLLNLPFFALSEASVHSETGQVHCTAV